MDYVYDDAFDGNISITGKTSSGKTTFVQKLGINSFFSKLLKLEWISYLRLSKNREAKMQTCFPCTAQFHYLRNLENLDHIIEYLKNFSTSQNEQNDGKCREDDHSDTSPHNCFKEKNRT